MRMRGRMRRMLWLELLLAVILPAIGMAAATAAGASDWWDEPLRLAPPSPQPDRIILTWDSDPATTQAVSWRTDTSVSVAAARLAPDTAVPEFADAVREFSATTAPLETERGVVHQHTVTFTGLRPGGTYRYRVGSEQGWSEWFRFRTAVREPEPFRFIYLGDSQNALLPYWAPVLRAAYARAPDARFFLHAGDLVDHSQSDGEWGEWFLAGDWIHATVPSIPSAGNHDYRAGNADEPILSPYWRAQFALPVNGPPGLEETVYFLDYQGVRVIVLDSNVRQQEQADWLRGVLAANPNDWTIALFHHPIYSGAQRRDNTELRALWEPIFDLHCVDLVLQGHDHTYARGRRPQSSGDSHESGGQSVYVVSVSGPKMYALTENRWMQRAGEGIQLYQVIAIDGGTLRYEAYTAADQLYDAFDLVKRAGRLNQLIERLAPGTPERREP